MNTRNENSLISTGEEYISFLGKGQYGCVHLISRRGLLIARKVINIAYHGRSGSREEDIRRELDILKRLNNRYLLHLYDDKFMDEYCWIDSEYCEGKDLTTLLQFSEKNKLYLNSNTIRRFFSNLVHGVHFLHSHSICHRDLKPDNIFLSNAGELVIGDVGVSKVGQDQYFTSKVGTPMYTPSEIYYGSKYTLKYDIYSLGFILYALCYNKPPNYYCKTHDDLKRFYRDMKFDPLPSHVDTRIEPLFRDMIKPEAERPDISQIIKHSFVTDTEDGKSLIQQFKYFCFPIKNRDQTNTKPQNSNPQQPFNYTLKQINDSYFHLSVNLIPSPPLEEFQMERYGYIGFYCHGRVIPSLNISYAQFIENLLDPKFILDNSAHFSYAIPLERFAKQKKFPDKALSFLRINCEYQVFNIYILLLRFFGFEIYINLKKEYIVKLSPDFAQRYQYYHHNKKISEIILMILESADNLQFYDFQESFILTLMDCVRNGQMSLLVGILLNNLKFFVQKENLLEYCRDILSRRDAAMRRH